jgi:hypothetical protein
MYIVARWVRGIVDEHMSLDANAEALAFAKNYVAYAWRRSKQHWSTTAAIPQGLRS